MYSFVCYSPNWSTLQSKEQNTVKTNARARRHTRPPFPSLSHRQPRWWDKMQAQWGILWWHHISIYSLLFSGRGHYQSQPPFTKTNMALLSTGHLGINLPTATQGTGVRGLPWRPCWYALIYIYIYIYGSFSETVYHSQYCDIGTKKTKCFKTPNMSFYLMFNTYCMWGIEKKDNLHYLSRTKGGSNDAYCQELTV